MSPDDISAAATELLEMRRTHRIEADLPTHLRPDGLAAAYAIQDQVVAELVADGEHRIGYKVACTNVIAQEALRIDRPVFGRLLSHTTSGSGAQLEASRFVHRVIEAEFAFEMARDVGLRIGGHDATSIAEFIGAVIPGIEIVDYRYESWSVGALQVAADNAIHGWWIRGQEVHPWQHFDLAAQAVRVSRGREAVTEGTGAAVLGHPLNVMAWLADELASHGRQLRAGDYVTTGVATDVFEAAAGDHLTADFGPLGSVTVSFV